MKARPLAALAALALSCSFAPLPSSAWARAAARPYDFNGDGRPDLVVGAALNRGSILQAGGIVVMTGSGRRPKIITQSTKNVAGGSEPGDFFGSTLASADFDRDGYADLAVGISGEDFTGERDAGAVTILYGSAKGLRGIRSRQFSEPSGKVAGAFFGSALTVGDLSGDGYPDLAVGAPGEPGQPGVDGSSGTVTVLLGGHKGLRTSGSRVLHGALATSGSDQDHGFGSSLAVADVDGTGGTDLVVVSRGSRSDVNDQGVPGSVSYCSGRPRGPVGCRRLIRSFGIRNNDAVVVGNVQGDDRPEIVVSATDQDFAYQGDNLGVLTLTGSGVSTSAHEADLSASDLGLPVPSEDDDFGGQRFGSSLAVGRVDGDSYDDLVIGAPRGVTGDRRGGWVAVVHGGANGLAKTRNAVWDQETLGVPGRSGFNDYFGAAVTLIDRNGDGKADLTIGAPGEDDWVGRVTTLLAEGGGFTTKGARTYRLRTIAPHYDNLDFAQFGSGLGQ